MRRLLLPLAALAAALAPLPSSVVDRVYAGWWYPRLQPLVTGASNLVPFAWLDLLLAVAVVAGVFAAARAWRATRGRWWRRAARAVVLLAQLAAAAYLLFLLAWGLNYRRPPTTERLHVSAERVTPARLDGLGARAVGRVNALHDPGRDAARLAGDRLILDLRRAFERAEHATGSPWRATPGRPKWSLVARGFPLAGVDGMINPFGLEVILNPEVLPFERPFVLAHEWAHLAGHAPEGEASFVAFVACLHGTRAAQYSGWLDLFLHVLRSVPPARRQQLFGELANGPRSDLRAI
jgi:hypothetical protein